MSRPSRFKPRLKFNGIWWEARFLHFRNVGIGLNGNQALMELERSLARGVRHA